MFKRPAVAGAMVLGLVLAGDAVAQLRIRKPVAADAAGAGMVQLPHTINDSQGNQWAFYNQSGQFQQTGNMPVYSQGGTLQVNNATVQGRGNQARLDAKTGELIFENLTAGTLQITRRVLVHREEGYARYIDIIKNPTPQEQTANLRYTSNINFGVQSSVMVADPKRKEQNIAWLAATHANGRVVIEMFGGKGAKSAPVFNAQPNNNQCQVVLAQTIPAGKEIALVHLHAMAATLDAAQKFVLELKEASLLASLPSALRRIIVNFRGGENFIGDVEILRGDILDVVELRSGDQLRGTLKEKSYKLQTFYGTIELPIEKVLGLISAGQFRPRHLVITRDGEIYGGRLEQEKLTLTLSSGQVAEIPVGQVSRMGYRKRAGDVEEWTFDKPLVLMRSGDRIAVQLPGREVEIATRYGALKLKAESIAALTFQAEEHGVHEIQLTDGSKFAGLVASDSFEMKLAGEGPEQVVRFPASAIRRLQFARAQESDEDEVALTLANNDVLVGALDGTLKLDTAFTTLTISAGEIKRLMHTAGSPTDVQVTLWDDTTVSGQLQSQDLVCRLKSGVEMKVPVGLVEKYVQPRPQPSASVVELITGLVAELNAEDWKQRDTAQEKLVAMGPIVIPTLKQLRAAQSPEAQQRIDLVLKQVEKASTREKKAGGTSGAEQ